MMLKVVLFPAPLGPIMPRISPSRTSKSRFETASSPPNRLVRLFTSRTADGIVKTDQAFRCNQDCAKDQQSEDQHVVVADQVRKCEWQQIEQHGTDHGAGVAPGAADDHHEQDKE